MNKVIIVGHSTSGLEEIEAQLEQYGMAAPLPSRREDLLPQEITSALCKAHRMPASDIPTLEADFQQIEAGPVWHGMALDLQLGNIEQERWGWSDPQSIFVLDHWHQLDPLAVFLLVYDTPQSALATAARHDAEEPDEERIKQRLENWAAYNGAMLRFFLRHPRRCLLVNTQQGLIAPNQLFERLDEHFEYNSKSLLTGDRKVGRSNHATGQPPASHRLQKLRNALTIATQDPAEALRILQASTTEHYLLDHYLNEFPVHRQLYEELQASANIPLIAEYSIPSHVGNAWKALTKQRRLTAEIIARLHQERYLLLTQMHQLQEELERIQPKAQSAHALYGAAERVKQQLSYRLGSKLVNGSRSVASWPVLPFVLLIEIHRYNQDSKRRSSKKLPPIHTYQDAAEASRVKNHLSYRLGTVLVQHGGTPWGWVKLPFAMRREIKAFKKSRKAKPSQRGKSTKSALKKS